MDRWSIAVKEYKRYRTAFAVGAKSEVTSAYFLSVWASRVPDLGRRQKPKEKAEILAPVMVRPPRGLGAFGQKLHFTSSFLKYHKRNYIVLIALAPIVRGPYDHGKRSSQFSVSRSRSGWDVIPDEWRAGSSV